MLQQPDKSSLNVSSSFDNKIVLEVLQELIEWLLCQTEEPKMKGATNLIIQQCVSS
jgi:hypothetical protein